MGLKHETDANGPADRFKNGRFLHALQGVEAEPYMKIRVGTANFQTSWLKGNQYPCSHIGTTAESSFNAKFCIVFCSTRTLLTSTSSIPSWNNQLFSNRGGTTKTRATGRLLA
jgi:hypothetical protein